MRTQGGRPASAYRGRIAPSRRAVTLGVVIAVHLLLLLMLLRLAAPPMAPLEERVPTVFDLSSAGEEAARTAAEPRPRAQAKAAPREKPRPTPPTPAPPRPAEPVDTSIWSKVMPLNRNDLAQADIAGLPQRPAGGEAVQTAETGSGRADSRVVGRAPNGEKLYDAAWYRHPTDAELSPYLPKTGVRTGWGEIACRMVEDYRVEDCQEIGQSPPGAGFSRAVRQAAWQFRVRPPRIDGKALLGTWVRIRIDYTERGAG